MIQEALYKVTHGQDLSYDLAKGYNEQNYEWRRSRNSYGWFLMCSSSERPYCR